MDPSEVKHNYHFLYIATVLDKVKSDVDITQKFVESLLKRPEIPIDDFLNETLYLNDSEINEKLTKLTNQKLSLEKQIEIFNRFTSNNLIKNTDQKGGIPMPPMPYLRNNANMLNETLQQQSIKYYNRNKYRPQTSRSNLINIINAVIDTEKELLDAVLNSLINLQTTEINNIKSLIYKDSALKRLEYLSPTSRPPSITSSILPPIPSPPRITSSILPPIPSNQRPKPREHVKEYGKLNLPIIKRGGGFLNNRMTDTLKSNCDNFNTFFIINYAKLKRHIIIVNQKVKERYVEEHESYGKLSLFGKLTFVETSFFRLLKYAIERILGLEEGKINEIKDGFIGKIMYFFTLFSSFTGITLPPLLAILGLTAVELAIKMAIIVAGCKVLGILLATNIAIIIIFYIKKAIDKRRTKAINSIRNDNPSEYENQPKVIGLMRLIRPNMTQNEYDNLKSNIKEFIFGVDKDQDKSETEIKIIDLKKKSEITYEKLPTINIQDDEDYDVLKTLILTTWNMIGNTEDPIGGIKHQKVISPMISYTNEDITEPTKSFIKIPENFNVSTLKKLTCSIILNLDIDDNNTTAFINKINKIIQIINELKQTQKGGSKIYNKLMTYKLNDLKMYYISKTGYILNNKYKKRNIVEKIIAITKSKYS